MNEVVDWIEKSKRARRRRRLRLIGLAVVGSVAGGAIGWFGQSFLQRAPEAQAMQLVSDADTNVARFSVCNIVRRTCVVDGDTFWLEGVKYRIADIDTPEISPPRCEYERELGYRARDRLLVLLNEGPFELRATARTDEDRYGRKLRSVWRDGQSLGAILVDEGLARRWTGRREPWC